MRLFTQAQADAFRILRKAARHAQQLTAKIGLETCHHCEHPETDPECPVCTLDLIAAQLERAGNEYVDKLELFLTQGPIPARPKRSPHFPEHAPDLGGSD